MKTDNVFHFQQDDLANLALYLVYQVDELPYHIVKPFYLDELPAADGVHTIYASGHFYRDGFDRAAVLDCEVLVSNPRETSIVPNDFDLEAFKALVIDTRIVK